MMDGNSEFAAALMWVEDELRRYDGKIFEGVPPALARLQAIRRALLLADKVTREPSSGFPSMEQVGAAAMYDALRSKTAGHYKAASVFRAMIAQAQKEITNA